MNDGAATTTPPAAPELCQVVCSQAYPLGELCAFIAAIAWGAWQRRQAMHWRAVSMRPQAPPVLYTPQVPPLAHMRPLTPRGGPQSMEPTPYRPSHQSHDDAPELLELDTTPPTRREAKTPPERPAAKRRDP